MKIRHLAFLVCAMVGLGPAPAEAVPAIVEIERRFRADFNLAERCLRGDARERRKGAVFGCRAIRTPAEARRALGNLDFGYRRLGEARAAYDVLRPLSARARRYWNRFLAEKGRTDAAYRRVRAKLEAAGGSIPESAVRAEVDRIRLIEAANCLRDAAETIQAIAEGRLRPTQRCAETGITERVR
jgi:hypothetical protein